MSEQNAGVVRGLHGISKLSKAFGECRVCKFLFEEVRVEQFATFDSPFDSRLVHSEIACLGLAPRPRKCNTRYEGAS